MAVALNHETGGQSGNTEESDFQRVLREGLAIQNQFSAEPVYARTGKGYLKPTGVAELEKIKSAKRAKWS